MNCATQYAVLSCSDHQAVTKHTTHTVNSSDRWCSEEERNHISGERGEERRRGEEGVGDNTRRGGEEETRW